jgi:hypothetical protein
MAITKRLVKGTPLTAAEMDANIAEIEIASSSLNILSGSFEASVTSTSASLSQLSSSLLAVSASVSNLSSLTGNISGQFTGSVFVSGSNASFKIDSTILANDSSTNRVLVHNNSTGVVGWSTVSGVSTSGTSGLDGTLFGSSGTSGINGTDGVDGTSGSDGTSGTGGTSGINGTDGTGGTSGTSGAGSAGTSGVDGTSGTGGTSGTSPAGASLTVKSYNGTAFSAFTFTGVDTLAFSGSAVELFDLGDGDIRVAINATTSTGGGTGGSAGTSGTSAEGSNGTSGTSGVNGFQGSNGTSGTSSTSSNITVKSSSTTVTTALSSLTFASASISVQDAGAGEVIIDIIGGAGGGGTSGTSGVSGGPGINGTSGTDGAAGTNGTDGTPGTSGTSGINGTEGTDGTAGTSGTSGLSTTLTVKDTGLTEISEVRFLQISGSGVTLTSLGSFSASLFFPGAGAGGSFNSASFEGWITSSQQILEAGFLLSSSANFTNAATRTYGIRATGSSLVYNFIGDVAGPNSTIGARVGDTLRFEVSASGHPFWIKTTPTTGAGSGITGVTNNGDDEGIVVWDTSAQTAGTFYYVSQNSTTLSGEIILGPALDGNKINGRGLAITGSIGLLGGQSVTGSLVVKGYTNLTGSVIVNGRNISNDLFTLTGSVESLPYYPNFYSAISDIQISGSLAISSSLTASLREGYVWVGGSGSVSTLLATSSLGGGGGNGDGIFSLTGSSYHTINNVVITGSLEVSGSVTASGFSVNTVGIPRLSSPSNLNLEALGGQVRIVTSSLRLATFTDAETSSLITGNGDMIYNSTAGKFFGYANGEWVALH